MFTGIVEKIAAVKEAQRTNDGLILTLATPKGWDLQLGDSVATNGVCLTVEKVRGSDYSCRLMAETLEKTTFGVAVPSQVNLERSMKFGERLNGHLVTGHVDAVGRLVQSRTVGDSKVYTIQFPESFRALVAPKGSVTINGVSLTVVSCAKDHFTVALVQYTLENTTLGVLKVNDVVNLEFDILAKYSAKTPHEVSLQKPASHSPIMPLHHTKSTLKPFDASSYRIGIVVADFNTDITDSLLARARSRAKDFGITAKKIVVHRVAGSVEIPFALKVMADSGRFDALVALGAIIRGETDHYDYVAKMVTEGVLEVMLDDGGIPIGFGVLTCDTQAQAKARLGIGGDALSAALHNAKIKKQYKR